MKKHTWLQIDKDHDDESWSPEMLKYKCILCGIMIFRDPTSIKEISNIDIFDTNFGNEFDDCDLAIILKVQNS